MQLLQRAIYLIIKLYAIMSLAKFYKFSIEFRTNIRE